jgi:MFS family permease
MITSILVYIPAGRIADRVGRKPVVVVTFLCFAIGLIGVFLFVATVEEKFAS